MGDDIHLRLVGKLLLGAPQAVERPRDLLADPLGLGAQKPAQPPQFHFSDDQIGEVAQLRLLGLVQGLAGLGIDQAEGAEAEAVAGDQRRTRVEADLRVAEDQRIVREAQVLGRVRHLQYPVFHDRKLAEGVLARRLVDSQADLGLEPLPGRIDQGNQADGDVELSRDQAGNTIECRFRRCVQDIESLQRGQSLDFVKGNRVHAAVIVPDEYRLAQMVISLVMINELLTLVQIGALLRRCLCSEPMADHAGPVFQAFKSPFA